MHSSLTPFVHRKLPLAARLGHCWGARPSWLGGTGDPPVAVGNLPTGSPAPHCPASRRPTQAGSLCHPPPQTAIGRCLRTATNWDIAGERARPGGRFRRRAKNRNPNGIESFSPRLRGRATLGWRPTNFPTRNGLHHLPPNRMKPRWGKIHFTIITRRSRCASTPG